MKPQRLGVKLFTENDVSPESIDLEPVIGLFHQLIREASVEGLLLDVADYRHVPNGPGVMIVGHEVDYGVDFAGGRPGLLVVRKRTDREIELGDLLADTLRKALGAAAAIAASDVELPAFSACDFEVQILDRIEAPNEAATAKAIEGAISPLLARVYGEGAAACTPANASEPRAAAAVRVAATTSDDFEALIARLPPAPPRKQVLTAGGWDITVEALQKLRDEGARFRLIDVREQNEYETANLGGELIPLATLGDRLAELDTSEHIVVHCKGGGRSAKAVEQLRAAGFDNAWSVVGGILAWSSRIDSSVPKY